MAKAATKKAIRSIGHKVNSKVMVSWDCAWGTSDSSKKGPIPHTVSVRVRPPNCASERPSDWARMHTDFPDMDSAVAFANMMWTKLS